MRTPKEIRSDYEEIVRAFARVREDFEASLRRVAEGREWCAGFESPETRKRMELDAKLMDERVGYERDIAFAVVSLRRVALQAECAHPNRRSGGLCPDCAMSEYIGK